jgi:hypothetical protein
MLSRHFLLCCFFSAVSFFWGGALLAIYSLQEVDRYLSTDSFLMLAASLFCVVLAYSSWWQLKGASPQLCAGPRDMALYKLARGAFVFVSIPAVFLASGRFISQAGVDYLDMDSVSPVSQVVAYLALYLYFLCLSLSSKSQNSRKEFFFLFLLVMLPRLMVGSISGRFVAVMPVIAFLFIGLSRGFIQFKFRAFLAVLMAAIYVLFVHPLLRAGEQIDVDSDTFMQVLLRSGPVNLMEQLDEVARDFHDVNFLKTGLIGNITPALLSPNERVDLWKREGLAVTADRAFAINEGAGFEEMFGPGSIYVGELYLIGGWFGVIAGSIVLGGTMAFAQSHAARISFWLVPLLDFVVKVPFVPRSNITYMYERFVPLLVFVGLTYFLAMALLKISLVAQKKSVGDTA